MKFKTFKQAEDFLYSQIPPLKTRKFPGEIGLKRTKYLLDLLNNPQEKIKIIHIAGTSGKGSTAYLISHLLQGLNFKTGLSLSPHLLDIRERFQVNGELISKEKFVFYVNQIIPFFNKMNKDYIHSSPTYFELVQAIGFLIYQKEKVDYAIIETGMGGIYDASNVIKAKNKICVITRMGLDHTNILGKTLKQITKQKAGIIQKGNSVIALKQRNNVNKEILKRTKQKNSKVTFVKTNKKIKTSLKGDFQKENASLAVAVIKHLSKKDNFNLNNRIIKKQLKSATFKGRFDIKKYKGAILIIDGAHNPQKINAFVSSLKSTYPNEKFIFIIAFKRGKDHKDMLDQIIKIASKIYITEFFTDNKNQKLSENKKKISKILMSKGFDNLCLANNIEDAFKGALKEKGKIVITGSLYLVSEIYPIL